MYQTTDVYPYYWYFAAERLKMYMKRLADPVGPWTKDPILQQYKFTNTFRAADRVSQYLIREVQYGSGRSQEPREVFFRTMLFNFFKKIETWEELERRCDCLALDTPKADVLVALDEMKNGKAPIYTAAYIMPSANYGSSLKHRNHVELLCHMVVDETAERIARATSLEDVYEVILSYPSMGRFLAFQYAIDLNYSTLCDFGEDTFVVAGPGAVDGIAKCFKDADQHEPEAIIRHMYAIQEQEFARFGLEFGGLFGRCLQLIDCQGLFCEISKYSRASHPEVQGDNGRTKIKQNFTKHADPVPRPFFPPKWGIDTKLGSC